MPQVQINLYGADGTSTINVNGAIEDPKILAAVRLVIDTITNAAQQPAVTPATAEPANA